MRKLHLYTGIGILLLAASPLVVPFFSPWSGINSRLQKVDMTSGRARETRYLFWIPVRQEVRETPLSRALSGVSSAAGVARWEPVSTFGPYVRHALHHSRHHALSNIKGLELVWNTFGMDSAGRVTTGLGLLKV